MFGSKLEDKNKLFADAKRYEPYVLLFTETNKTWISKISVKF